MHKAGYADAQHNIVHGQGHRKIARHGNNGCPDKYNYQTDKPAGYGKHDGFEQELKQDKIPLRTQRLLDPDDMGPFLYGNKHDICYPESANYYGEDTDKESRDLKHRKKLIQLVIDNADLVQCKLIFIKRP
jgi:hypothetical protein